MRLARFLLVALFACTAAHAQRYDLGDTSDLQLVLLNEVEPGTAAYAADGEAVLTTEDFAGIEVELSEGRYDEHARYNLLLKLTPMGAFRLKQATRANVGRSLVLRSHGRTFNALRIDAPMSGRRLVWRVLLPEHVTQDWAEHIVGTLAPTAELPSEG